MNNNIYTKAFKCCNLITFLGIATLALLILVQIVSAAPDQTKHDLTGVWNCDDTGTYYLRQIDNNLYWYSELGATSTTWSTTAYGIINGNTINLKWVDLPKGGTSSNGKLTLNIVSNDELKLTQMTGGFGGSHWTRSGTASSNSSTSDSSGTVTGQSQASILVETDHPCANSYHHTWTISTPPDTTQMRIHFAKLDIGNDDELSLEHNSGYLKDFSINDNKQDFWTDWYGVNSMDVVLGTSSTKAGWGFKIDKLETKNNNGVQSTPTTRINTT
jgi:hypothetical protein